MFWDTSALLPLFVSEKESRRARSWLRRDPVVVVWTLTRVELLSALARRERKEPSAARGLARARAQVLAAWEEWSEIVALEPVRRQAERLLAVHPRGVIHPAGSPSRAVTTQVRAGRLHGATLPA